MRSYQTHKKTLNRTERSDFLTTLISALTPLYRASTEFSAMHLFTAAPLLHNYLRQLDANAILRSQQLQKEIDDALVLLPSDIQQHFKDSCRLRAEIEDLEKQLDKPLKIDPVSGAIITDEACIGAQTKIDVALNALLIAERALEGCNEKINLINKKQDELHILTKKIREQEQGFQAVLKKIPIDLLSNSALLLSLGVGFWSGGLPQLIQMGLDLGLYYGLSSLVQELASRLSFEAYQNDPDNFNDLLWARAMAVTKTAVNLSAAPISKKLTRYIVSVVEQFSGIERIAFDKLPFEKANNHTKDFLAQQPTLVVQPGKPVLIVDAEGQPILYETHSNTVARSQWNFETNNENVDVYVSARGIPYVTVSPKLAAPYFPESLSSVPASLSNIAFLSAVYAVFGPIGVFGMTLLSQITTVLADSIPAEMKTALDKYYVDQLQVAYLKEFGKNQTIDASKVIATFNALFNLTKFVTTIPAITHDQSKYLIDAGTAVANARLTNWQQAAQKELKLRKAEGILVSAGLPQSIVDELFDKTLDPLVLATATATAEMKDAAQFYWKTLSLIKASAQVNADPSLATLGKYYADQVFQSGYINQVLSYLKAYAKTSSELAKNNLLAALNEQLTALYGPGSTLSTEAQEIKKMAIDYVLNNAPWIVKAVDSVKQIQKFFNTDIQYFDDAAGNLTTLACDLIGSDDCNTLMHFESILSSDVMLPFESLGKFVAHLDSRVSNFLKTTLLQNLSPAQKIAYQKELQDVSVDFAAVSNLAILFGSPKEAAKILAIGKVTVGILETLSFVKKINGVVTDIGKFAAKIMPVLNIVNGIFKIFSMVGGGKSVSEQYDKAILEDLNVLIKQVQTVIKIEIDISKEIGQLYSAMQSGFIDVLKHLKIIFDAILQGEAITDAMILKTQTLIRQLSFQVFELGVDILNQDYQKAKTDVALLTSSEAARAYPLFNVTMQSAMMRFYQRAVVDSTTDPSLRNVGMEGISKMATQQSMIESAEANNLGIVAPEYSIQFFQNIVAAITQKQYPNLANALTVIETANVILTSYFGFASEGIYYAAEKIISDLIQAGAALIQFGLDVRNSEALWKKLIGDYQNVLTQFLNNAAAIMQNAWQAYVSSSQYIADTYTTPMNNAKNALLQRVLSFQYNGQYDQTPLNQLFTNPGNGNCVPTSTTIADIVNAFVFAGGIQGYLNSVASSVSQFDTVAAFLGIFSGSFNTKYPNIAFDSSGVLPPVDLTSSVTLDPVVSQGIDAGVITKTEFSFSLAAPTLTFNGIYTLQDGSQVTFFTGSFTFPATNAGTMVNLPSFVNPHSSSFTVYACADPVAPDCIAICDTGQECFANLDFGDSPNAGDRSIVGMLLFPNDHGIPLNDCLSPADVGTYQAIANIIYNAVLMNGWETQYKNTPIANTAQWADQKAHLMTLIAKQQSIISGNFFNDIFSNPSNPAYAPLTKALEALGAAYNLIVSFLHFGFSDYTKGSHSVHQNSLCVPVNQWKSNGTAFADQDGVQCNAIPGSRTTMQSNYSVIVRDKELRIDWSSLNNASAQMGLQLGSETLITLDPSIYTNASFHTRVTEIQLDIYLATTVDQNGTVIRSAQFDATTNEMVLHAFVESADVQQGIRIANATILQKNTTIPANATSWKNINTPANNETIFSENSITFFSQHESNPMGFSKVRTNHTYGLSGSNLYFVWQADSGMHSDPGFHKKPYNMTVGIDLGEQNNVAEFQIGSHGRFVSKTPYYTRLMVASDTITCVTCRDRFDDEGGFPIENMTQNNNFASDFSTIAIHISKSNAPDGRQSVSVLPIRIVGFETSVLPEPMSAAQWRGQNIIRTPHGLTIESSTTETLTSKQDFVLRDREIWMKWKMQGTANIALHLSGQSVFTCGPVEQNEWVYMRVVVFNKYVEIKTAYGNYDLNPGATGVSTFQTSVTIPIGEISWAVNGAGTFTLGECMMQDAANTILSQKGAGLLSQAGMMNALLSAPSTPQAVSDLMKKLKIRSEQLQEMLNFTRTQPAEADPDIVNIMKLSTKAQQMVLVSGIAKALLPSYDDFPRGQLTVPPADFTKTASASKTRSVSGMSGSNLASASVSGSSLVSASESVSSPVSASVSGSLLGSTSRSQPETHSVSRVFLDASDQNHAKIYLAVAGGLTAGVGITAFVLCMRNRGAGQQNEKWFSDTEMTNLFGSTVQQPINPAISGNNTAYDSFV